MGSDLPFAPGTSPFHAKGTIYLSAFDHFERNVAGGREAVIRSIADPDVVRFFRQPFLAGSWYDVFPSTVAHQAAAAILRQPFAEYARGAAKLQAQRDVHGIYRVMLKLASPELVVSRLPKVAAQYFDFVRAEIETPGPRHYVSQSFGIPTAIAPVYLAVSEAFLDTTLTIAGARNLRQHWWTPEPDGHRAGVDLVRVRREIRWE